MQKNIFVLVNCLILATTMAKVRAQETAEIYSPIEARYVGPEKKIIEIYPNPSHGIINIDFRGRENVKLSVYNTVGKCIFKKKYDGAVFSQMDLRGRSRGVYLIEICSEQGTLLKKISLQ